MRILVLLLLLFSKAFASLSNQEACSWSVAGEWTYFLPSFDQSEYVWKGVSQGFPSGEGIRVGEQQQFYSGFRVDASYLFANCTNDITLRYLWFNRSYSTRDAYNEFTDVIGISSSGTFVDFPGTNQFRRSYHYYTIDGLVGLYRKQTRCFSRAFSIGPRFVHLHIKEEMHNSYPGPAISSTLDPDMRAWALGLAGAFDGAYMIANCFSIVGRAQVGLLSSKSRSQFGSDATIFGAGGRLSSKNTPAYWHVIPDFDLRLGGNLSTSFWKKLHLDFEGGYEWINESTIVSRIQVMNAIVDAAFSFNEWSDFTLQGPYVRVNLNY